MPYRTALVICCLSLLVGSVATANDIVLCPVSDNHPKEMAELQTVFIGPNMTGNPNGLPPGASVLLVNGYYGVTDRLEISTHTAQYFGIAAAPQYQVNVHYELLKSSRPDRPKVSIGAYNIDGTPILNYAGVEPYIMIGHNLFTPDGPPDWDDPVVRLFAGYGTSGHGVFGGIVTVWDEDVATFVGWHGGAMSASAQICFGDKNQYMVAPSYFRGSPSLRVAYQHPF